MDRRSFFRNLICTTAGFLSLASSSRAETKKRIVLQQSPVAGFQYHDGETVWDRLRVGAPLSLMREPENSYDRRAIRLEWSGRKLGYVPRAENAVLSQLMDSGQTLHAEIVELRKTQNPWERVKFIVTLTT
jgi:hypothetical protein